MKVLASQAERILHLSASIIGVIWFVLAFAQFIAGLGSDEPASPDVLSALSPVLAFTDNLLIALVAFSLIDIGVAILAASLMCFSVYRLGILNIVVLPSILVLSYLTFVTLMDLIFYAGEYSQAASSAASTEEWLRLSWPLILSVVLGFAAICDRDRRILKQLDENADLRSLVTFEGYRLSSELKRVQGRARLSDAFEHVPPPFFYSLLFLAHMSVAIAAANSYH